MTNSTNQATVLTLDEVVEQVKETKQLNTNGCPVYKMSFQTILDAGYTLENIVEAAKNQGMRQNRKKENVSFQSYNLAATLKDFFADL